MKLTYLVVPLPALTACYSDNEKTKIAYPASVFCEKQGGKVEIRDEADGQVGYCHLPDSRVIKEWKILSGEQSPIGQKDLRQPPTALEI